MNFLSQQEKDEQLINFNETVANYTLDRYITELISEQARMNPTEIAIKGGQLEWTYDELDKITNQLARCLKESHGVAESDLVGVKLDNSEWAIASLLGILKAGAAYVPIDPAYPESRRQFILNESNIKLLVTDTNYMFDEEDFDGTLFAVDVEFEQDEFSGDPLETKISLNSPAYVIYTSGSTGNPKGVVVSHKSLANYLLWAKAEYANSNDALNLGLFSSLSFDLTVTSIYLPLITGGYLNIFPSGAEISSLLSEYLSGELNAIKLTPAHVSLAGAMDIRNSNIQVAIVGGDALNSSHIEILQELNPHIRIYNEYGPTEATVGCIVKEIQSEKEANCIGKPIGNTQVYLLSSRNDIQPLGVTGEICISGDGLAVGYLNDAEKTDEKFIKHPFIEGERLYKTGDIGKWQADGNMIFVGRKDFQIKLKGYRIELGEIEESLVQNAKVDGAAVSAVSSKDDQEKELVAYFTSDDEVNRTELITFLKQRLPDYMIPSRFIQLDEFPLTTNGKIDRKALPDPFESEIDSGTEYVAPSTDNEKALVAVCEDVMKQSKVSVKDNFYHLGGDSIKSIQVVARLKQRGLSLKVEHILKHPVLVDLAKFIEASVQSVDQTEVSGNVKLTPIQKWFFESSQIVSHDYFNQSVLLKSTVQLDDELLKASLIELTNHHDALRMVFPASTDGWEQVNQQISESAFELSFHDLTEVDNPEEEIINVTEQLQKSISIEQGPLVKVARIRTKSEDFLALIIHHLVVDGVSWRILLEDLASTYTSLLEGKQSEIPAKTDAYQTWAKQLTEYASSEKLKSEEEYWNRIVETETEVLIDDS
ncbi:MAG: amino acid adenylation domain-containing protein, partial [Crocinitomicaceae bacterium]